MSVRNGPLGRFLLAVGLLLAVAAAVDAARALPVVESQPMGRNLLAVDPLPLSTASEVREKFKYKIPTPKAIAPAKPKESGGASSSDSSPVPAASPAPDAAGAEANFTEASIAVEVVCTPELCQAPCTSVCTPATLACDNKDSCSCACTAAKLACGCDTANEAGDSTAAGAVQEGQDVEGCPWAPCGQLAALGVQVVSGCDVAACSSGSGANAQQG